MHRHEMMKRLLVLCVAALALCISVGSEAQPRRRAAVPPAKKHGKHRPSRAKARAAPPLASQYDEVVLSPVQMRQLQQNLADGGYRVGRTDGRLCRRTRKADPLRSLQRKRQSESSAGSGKETGPQS
jgi:hypothetical protein